MKKTHNRFQIAKPRRQVMKRKKGQEGQKAVSIDSIVTIGWKALRSNIHISMRASAFSQVIHRNSNDIEGVSPNLRLINGSFLTLSSHLFANYMIIFHKTEVQTVILRCWMGLYLNWFKSYDTKCNFFHFRFSAIL